MTEKRFRFDTGCIIDMQENKVLTDRQAINLLNHLHEENQELRKDVIYWRHKALNEEPVNCRCEVKYND